MDDSMVERLGYSRVEPMVESLDDYSVERMAGSTVAP